VIDRTMTTLPNSLTPVSRRFSKSVLWLLYTAACVPLFVGSCGIILVGRDAVRSFIQFGLPATFHDMRLFFAFGFFGDMMLLGASSFVVPWCRRRNRTRTAFWATVALLASLAVVILVSYFDRSL
jgi:hypothetical protein